MSDPDFAYNVIRPLVVVAGYVIGMQIGWRLMDRWLDRRPRAMRNVTRK